MDPNIDQLVSRQENEVSGRVFIPIINGLPTGLMSKNRVGALITLENIQLWSRFADKAKYIQNGTATTVPKTVAVTVNPITVNISRSSSSLDAVLFKLGSTKFVLQTEDRRH